MPPDFTSLAFGFTMLGQLLFVSAYGGNVPPPPIVSTAVRFEPGGGGLSNEDFLAPCPMVIQDGPKEELSVELLQSAFRKWRQ